MWPSREKGEGGGEGKLTLIASAAERTRGAIGACMSRADCQLGLPGTRKEGAISPISSSSQTGQRSHRRRVLFNRRQPSNRNDIPDSVPVKTKMAQICTEQCEHVIIDVCGQNSTEIHAERCESALPYPHPHRLPHVGSATICTHRPFTPDEADQAWFSSLHALVTEHT
jgi:hypothetical protein